MYLINDTLLNLEQKSQFLFLGSNLRMEAPLLNARLRKSYLNNFDFKAYSIGLALNHLTYPVFNFGNSVKSFISFLEGRFIFVRNFFFNDYFNFSYFNSSVFDLDIFVGNSFLNRIDSNFLIRSLLSLVKKINIPLNNIHFISSYLGKLSAFELGLIPSVNSYSTVFKGLNLESSFIYLCGVDLENFRLNKVVNDSFIVFQGSFFSNKLIDFVNLILPSSVYTEEVSSYII